MAAGHDLIVIAAGRGSLTSIFARRPERSPYEVPQRRLSAGIYHGIEYSEPKGVGVHLSLGHGELLELPIFLREGFATALLFEAIPGGDLEVLAEISYDDDRDAFHRVVLEKIERHFPMLRERVDAGAFALQGPDDILQGALTPVMREDWVRLDGGRYAIAVGDVHCLVDPSTARAPTRPPTRRGSSGRRSSRTTPSTSSSRAASRASGGFRRRHLRLDQLDPQPAAPRGTFRAKTDAGNRLAGEDPLAARPADCFGHCWLPVAYSAVTEDPPLTRR